ncbi:VOC family protein [Streptomyces sp. UG1]|uniref:VOC family protein n=1 Tax=Streptomyces sp. UG1 TaxID=3417652 RepID=UPI003CF73E85
MTTRQYPAMKEFAQKALDLDLVSSSEEFSVFTTSNGNLFELYGPKAPQYPWRTSPTSIAFGFNTTNLDKAMTQLQNNGAEWVSTVQVVPGAGAGGSDYRFRLFRAPDNRVYAISQSNTTS